jgi:hypothetical protein
MQLTRSDPDPEPILPCARTATAVVPARYGMYFNGKSMRILGLIERENRSITGHPKDGLRRLGANTPQASSDKTLSLLIQDCDHLRIQILLQDPRNVAVADSIDYYDCA